MIQKRLICTFVCTACLLACSPLTWAATKSKDLLIPSRQVLTLNRLKAMYPGGPLRFSSHSGEFKLLGRILVEGILLLHPGEKLRIDRDGGIFVAQGGGLRFVGSRIAPIVIEALGQSGYMIEARKAALFEMSHVRISGCGRNIPHHQGIPQAGQGLWIERMQEGGQVSISNCIFRNNQAGILLINNFHCKSISLKENLFEGQMRESIVVYNSRNIIVNRNNLIGNYYDFPGIYVVNCSAPIVISENLLEKSDAIFIYGGSGGDIFGNQVVSSERWGIRLSCCRDFVLKRNIISFARWIGLFIHEGAQQNRVEEFTARNCGVGLKIQDASKNLVVNSRFVDSLNGPDIMVEENTESQLEKCTYGSQQVDDSPNLLLNSSFEICTNYGLPDSWDGGICEDLQEWGVDKKVALHGRHSLRLGTDYVNKWTHSLDILQMLQERTGNFIFSIYFKSDREDVQMALCTYDFKDGKWLIKHITVGKEWRRYTLSCKITDRSRDLRFHFFKVTRAPVWADAAQLERGKNTSDYRSADPNWGGHLFANRRYTARNHTIAVDSNPASHTSAPKRLRISLDSLSSQSASVSPPASSEVIGGPGPNLSYYSGEGVAAFIFQLDPKYNGAILRIWGGGTPSSRPFFYAEPQVDEAGRAVYSLPVQSLPMGVSFIKGQLFMQNELLAERIFEVRRVSPRAHGIGSEVKIDRVKRCLLFNGEPFFGFGGSCTLSEDIIPILKAHGYNYVHTLLESPDSEDFSLKLDAMHSASIKYTISFHKIYQKYLRAIKNRHSNALETSLQDVRRLVEKFKSSPSLLTWEIFDEPDAGEKAKDWAQQVKEMLLRLDPYHPVEVNYCDIRSLSKQSGIADVISVDNYPIPHATMVEYDDWIAEVASTLSNEPLQTIIQGHGNVLKLAREPTPEELTCMTYCCLVRGATIIAYHAYYRPRSHLSWRMIKQLGQELRLLAPAILSSYSHREGEVLSNSNSIRVSLRKVGHSWYLISVNIANVPVQTEMILPTQLRKPFSVINLFDQNKSVVSNGSKVILSYPPLGRIVLKIELAS